MSLAVQPLKPYGILDSVVKQMAPEYPVVTGARAVSYQVNGPSSISDASEGGQLNFDINPAHENVYVDRLMYLRLPVRMKIAIPTNAACNDGIRIIVPGRFGLRSFPAQKAMETIQLNINGLPSSIEIGKLMSALELFDVKERMRRIDCSKCATYPVNQSQAFYQLTGLARSPLSDRAAGPEGAFNLGSQFTVLTNAVTASNAGEAWIDFVSTEALHISPLYFSAAQDDNAAFLGINSMSIQINFATGGGNRMICVDATSTASPLFTSEANARAATVNCTMYFQNHASVGTGAWSYPLQNQAAILVKQLAPSEVDENLKLKIKNYPYTQTRVWVTSVGSTAAAASSSVVSANMQLASIPSKVISFIRARDVDLRRNPFAPDTFFQIQTLTALWGVDNRLNGASQEQLYDIAVQNGLEVDWQSWSGTGINSIAGVSAANYGLVAYQYAGCGSVAAFGPMDLGLPLRQAPGKSEYFNLQLTVGYKNVAPVTVTADLFVCVVSQGVYSIYDGQASSTLGILSENDVLNANKTSYSHMLTYNEARELYGGAMADTVKDEMKAVLNSARPAGTKVSRESLRQRLA